MGQRWRKGNDPGDRGSLLSMWLQGAGYIKTVQLNCQEELSSSPNWPRSYLLTRSHCPAQTRVGRGWGARVWQGPQGGLLGCGPKIGPGELTEGQKPSPGICRWTLQSSNPHPASNLRPTSHWPWLWCTGLQNTSTPHPHFQSHPSLVAPSVAAAWPGSSVAQGGPEDDVCSHWLEVGVLWGSGPRESRTPAGLPPVQATEVSRRSRWVLLF